MCQVFQEYFKIVSSVEILKYILFTVPPAHLRIATFLQKILEYFEAQHVLADVLIEYCAEF
jgi:hypothetical protein